MSRSPCLCLGGWEWEGPSRLSKIEALRDKRARLRQGLGYERAKRPWLGWCAGKVQVLAVCTPKVSKYGTCGDWQTDGCGERGGQLLTL